MLFHNTVHYILLSSCSIIYAMHNHWLEKIRAGSASNSICHIMLLSFIFAQSNFFFQINQPVYQFNSPALVILEISAFQNSCVLFTVSTAKSWRIQKKYKIKHPQLYVSKLKM